MRICMPVIGLNGSHALAIKTLKTLPKLDEATILMYLMLQLGQFGGLYMEKRDLRIALGDTTNHHRIDNN